ncbi:hypothetical protein RUM44_005164 [Polyplax serrata]|uniref:Uncharacterized protein n=1 Tax=Polyplax serrata TaxID=468196 RepID=A0ABR1AEP0_POLSC
MKKSGKESRKEVKGCSDSDMKVLEKLQEPGTSSGRVRQERSPLKTTTLLNHFVGRDKQGAHTSYSTHQHSTDTDSTKECPTVVSVSGRYELYRNFIKRADDSVALGGDFTNFSVVSEVISDGRFEFPKKWSIKRTNSQVGLT